VGLQGVLILKGKHERTFVNDSNLYKIWLEGIEEIWRGLIWRKEKKQALYHR
jgi:hypothetical protein